MIFLNFHFKTLGCKVNQYETEGLREAFLRFGHTADSSLEPDVIIINSCTVTAESDRKTRQMIHAAKKSHPGAVTVLTGCMAQAFPEESKITGADIIIGNRNPNRIIEAVNRYTGERYFEIGEHKINDIFTALPITDFSERTRAFMKIEDGCNRRCSYCIIPKARGFVRSRSLESIRTEASSLADNGFCEIVLVGINLSAYGLGSEYNICDAVETVARVDKIKRIRLGSLEPDHITDQMLKRLSSMEKFCPQFHLSLQSGSDKTLKRMNRHYTADFYADLVRRIRTVFPDAAITTDIMVGFAGETEEEFNESLDFVKKIGFARSHIFIYSRRPGTPADTFENQIDNAQKKRRSDIMACAAKESERQFLKSQVGKVFPVLFETAKGGVLGGYTPNYTRVTVQTNKQLTGQILPVLITDSADTYCIGKIKA